jgi:hypothetical protein
MSRPLQKSIFLTLAIITIALAGCATAPSASISELVSSADTKVENIGFNSGYVELGKCWDRNAEKPKIDFANAAHITFNEKESFAVVAHAWSAPFSTKLMYGSVIFIRAASSGGSTVSAYGNGYSAKSTMPNWLGTLKDCDLGYTK